MLVTAAAAVVADSRRDDVVRLSLFTSSSLKTLSLTLYVFKSQIDLMYSRGGLLMMRR